MINIITINFYKDGAYVKGHDINEICNLISYAMWSCIEDCLQEDEDVYHYESGFDENWKHLGFTYMKINLDCKEHNKILERFRNNITYWLTKYDDRVKINNNLDELIDFKLALQDAKREQGLCS